jgi:hypothetical protein
VHAFNYIKGINLSKSIGWIVNKTVQAIVISRSAVFRIYADDVWDPMMPPKRKRGMKTNRVTTTE